MFATVHHTVDAGVCGVLAQEPSHPWRVGVAPNACVVAHTWPAGLSIGPRAGNTESLADLLALHLACISRETTIHIASPLTSVHSISAPQQRKVIVIASVGGHVRIASCGRLVLVLKLLLCRLLSLLLIFSVRWVWIG